MTARAAAPPGSDGGPAPRELLRLCGITRTFGTATNPVPVLRGIDLAIHEREFVAVVGASGSGKSTLLNILGCLDRPTAGSYHLLGQDVSRLDDHELSRIRKTRIGFVFQSFQLVAHLSVEENVELPLFYARVPRRRRRAQARALIERVGLGHRGHHFPNELSGGESQRAAIARALVAEPALILADEPTGNLDSATSASIMQLFFDLHAGGCTILIITHDPAIARTAARRITMCDGLVAADSAAPPREAACSAS